MIAAVIYTPGRTGSNLILQNLAGHYRIPMYSETELDIEYGIVHSHDARWIPPHKNFISIISRRRNLFDCIMSSLVGKLTKEFVRYTQSTVDPVTVSKENFTQRYWNVKCFYHFLPPTDIFKQTVDIYYEDLMADPRNLFRQFGIEKDTNYSLITKSPYRYQDIISNHEELRIVFDELSQLPIPDVMLKSFRAHK